MKTNNYEIEKDKVLNVWIVWKLNKNCKVEVFRSKLKRDCKKFIVKNINKVKKKNRKEI